VPRHPGGQVTRPAQGVIHALRCRVALQAIGLGQENVGTGTCDEQDARRRRRPLPTLDPR
jgi:hypothetical protein